MFMAGVVFAVRMRTDEGGVRGKYWERTGRSLCH